MSMVRASKPGWQRYREDHPVVLMASLLLLLVVFPAFESAESAAFVLNAFITVMLAGSAWAVAKHRRQLIAVIALGMPVLAVSWAGSLTSAGTGLEVCGLLLQVAFIVLVTTFLLKSLLTAPRVTGNILCRAVSVYLLMGVCWAMVYRGLALVSPGAFATAPAHAAWGQYIYFSFTVLTTLGLGDITPATAYARSLVILQSVLGPLYLAILVARLVAMYERDRPTNNS